jgi:hypothetical protein
MVLHLNVRLLALPTNIRSRWHGKAVISPLAYYDTATTTAAKSFKVQTQLMGFKRLQTTLSNYAYLSIYPSVRHIAFHTSGVCLSICLYFAPISLCLSVCLSSRQSIHVHICVSIYPSVFLYPSLAICLLVCPYICLSLITSCACLSICFPSYLFLTLYRAI